MKNLNTKWVKPFIISLFLYHHSISFPKFFLLTYFHQPFLQAVHSCCCWKVLSHVWLFKTPWTVAHQAPLSMGFPRQEYWTGLSFPSSGHLPNPGVKSGSLGSVALASRFFLTSATWETPAYSWVWLSDHHWFSLSTLICHIPSLFRESSYMYVRLLEVFPGGSPANAGVAKDAVSTPGLERFPGEVSSNAPVFLPRKLHGERSLLWSMGLQRVRHDSQHVLGCLKLTLNHWYLFYSWIVFLCLLLHIPAFSLMFTFFSPHHI